MCGIAGIISADPRLVTHERLQSMSGCLSHRGADGVDQWIAPTGTAGFSHRRLAILDLSAAGNQPMHWGERYTIVHNGEVYNYLELKTHLQKKDYHFKTATDTEVILAAYDCFGEECVDHFNGMFAFAIWDHERQSLFAARDRFGEKPFYYFFDDKQIVFASEIKALWAAGVPRVINQKMAFNYLTIGYLDNPNDVDETFYEHINKLPPAHTLRYALQQNEIVLERYWDLDPEKTFTPVSEAAAMEQFRDLFFNSVDKRYRSDVPIATSLSGGLDSSSLVAAAASLKPSTHSYTCFTASFPGFDKDETQHARQVAEHFSLKQFLVNPNGNDLVNELEKFIRHQEMPPASASVFIQYKVYQLASQKGIKVLLDGQGADELLAGYHKYYKWYWQELFRDKKLWRSGELKKSKALGIEERFGLRNVIAALAPDLAGVILEQQYLANALTHPDLTKDFVRQQSKEAYYTRPAINTLNGALYFNTMMHGLEELLHYADRNSMAHGCEVRLPFLDHTLAEFIFSLPSTYKIRDGWTKWLLRRTMENDLPGEIVWRKDKVGYEPPQQSWMQLPSAMEAIIESKKKLVDEKVLKPSVLQKKPKAMGAHEAGNYDWRYWMLASVW